MLDLNDVVYEGQLIQWAVESLEGSVNQGFDDIAEILGSEVVGSIERGCGELSGQVSNVANILEWGFEEIKWKFDQTGKTLGSIERTLKTPGQTKANEQRKIAEELRRRGVLNESVKFFLRSLDENPLDYRTYIGLGKTYLKLGKLDEAKRYWAKSLPHAPRGWIDYKSYTHRLFGRTFYYENNIPAAICLLENSVELSPNYYWGYYDLAQYCAIDKRWQEGFNYIQAAVQQKPSLLELAQKEKNLYYLMSWSSVREEIKFREAWRELGVSHRCIDEMIHGLENLIREEGGAGCLSTIRKTLAGIVQSERGRLQSERLERYSSDGFRAEIERMIERDHRIDSRLYDIIQDVQNLRLWPQLTVPINNRG